MTTGRIGITSDSLIKLGKYPSELNWSSLGDVLGFYKLQDHTWTKLCYRW